MKKMCSLVLSATIAMGGIFPMYQPVFAEGKVRPQDDFFTASNEAWLKEAKIPEGYSSWGNTDILYKKASDDLKLIIESYRNRTDLKEGSDEKKIVDLYNAFVDYKSRNEQGAGPIKGYTKKINDATSLKELQLVMSELAKIGNDSVFTYMITADPKDSSKNILDIEPGSLGLDDVEYYSSSDQDTKNIQKAYKEYLTKLFVLNGDDKQSASKKAQNVYDYEKSIAAVMLSKEEAMDLEKQYNVYTMSELEKLAPNLNWKASLSELGLEKAKKIIVGQPEYFKKLNTLLEEKNLESYKNYLEAIVLRESAGMLSSDFEKAQFEYEKIFSGVDTMLPVDERAVSTVDGLLGELLGKVYVEKRFSKEAKADVELMVKDIIDSYEDRINGLDWISEATKKRAIKKLETMDIKIGYPNKWEDYSSVNIKTYKNGGSLYENVKNINEYFRLRQLSKLDQPVDRTEWGMTPQTVNAYYNPTVNEIVFPAGILQDPFYKYGAGKAKNLGGIGTVIGHEISHAFDDMGSKFDENGNMVNWWTDKDLKEYQKRTAQLVAQYDKYEVLPNEFVNGTFTLGENIADLGGVEVALDSLETTQKSEYEIFFKSYSGIWKEIQTEELSKFLLTVDSHSPVKFRVNGVLTNVDEFYETYGVKEGDKLYTKSENRIDIW
ncbi:MAG: M13 family metallopeptidase [Proteocatella sp.]